MNTPGNPWHLLGLDPTTATERDVKRAYARLLKVHRPDTDPEGFQKLHAAYQEALEMIGGPVNGTIVPDTAEPPESPPLDERTAEPEEQELPPNFIEAAEGLRRERDQRTNPALASRHFNTLRNVVHSMPDLAGRWAQVLYESFSSAGDFAHFLDKNDAYMLAEAGEFGLCAQILLAWRETPAGLAKLSNLAALLLSKGLPHQPDAAPRLILLVARLTAFHLPEITVRLIDHLFQILDVPARKEALPEVEARLAAGSLFRSQPQPERLFWEKAIFESGGSPMDWRQPEAREALGSLAEHCSASWQGWQLIRQIVPPEQLEPLLKGLHPQRVVSVRRVRPAPSPLKVIFSAVCALFFIIAGIRSALERKQEADPIKSFRDTLGTGKRQPAPPVILDSGESPEALRRLIDKARFPPNRQPGTPLNPTRGSSAPAAGLDLKYDPLATPSRPGTGSGLWQETPGSR